MTVTVRRARRPVSGAVVRVAGERGVTDARGRALVTPALGVPGSFAALAQKGVNRGRSRFLQFGPAPAASVASFGGAPR